MKKKCPNCGKGKPGIDSLCDKCWREYLGTHVGGRGHWGGSYTEDATQDKEQSR